MNAVESFAGVTGVVEYAYLVSRCDFLKWMQVVDYLWKFMGCSISETFYMWRESYYFVANQSTLRVTHLYVSQ